MQTPAETFCNSCTASKST